MKKKVALTEISTPNDLLIDLTFHDVTATLIVEFAQKIVRPYYKGNLNRALKELMESPRRTAFTTETHN
jgi:hypothetical protein